MAGYSASPLSRKLGITTGSQVLLDHAPAGLELTGLPDDVVVDRTPDAGPYDVIVGFCADFEVLARDFERWRRVLVESGGLWIAWPKRASGMRTDLTDVVVRTHGLAAGLVDNKVAAIDATWSGLRFVVRVGDRSSRRQHPEAG